MVENTQDQALYIQQEIDMDVDFDVLGEEHEDASGQIDGSTIGIDPTFGGVDTSPISFVAVSGEGFDGSLVNVSASTDNTSAPFVAQFIRPTRIVCLDQQERAGDEMAVVFNRGMVGFIVAFNASDEHMKKGESSGFIESQKVSINSVSRITLFEKDFWADDRIGGDIGYANIPRSPGEFKHTFSGDGAKYEVWFSLS